jgi:branched-chain amino acid transport system substrate-binding protein
VALISPWSTNPQTTLDVTTNEPKKYVFRAAFVDAFQGQVVAYFALDFLQTNRAAVLFDVESDYNRGIAEIFKQTYEDRGGKVVAFETYVTGETDFTNQLNQIKESDPDVIFLPNYYTDVPLQIQQAHQLGITAPFLGSDTWGSPELLAQCGAECEGYYFSTHYAPDSANPLVTRFSQDYQKAYGEVPDDVAALTYDSFGLLWQALQTAGQMDRQKVADALHSIESYEGVTGSMMFQQGSGDPIKSAVILQIRNGKFVWLANINP